MAFGLLAFTALTLPAFTLLPFTFLPFVFTLGARELGLVFTLFTSQPRDFLLRVGWDSAR